MFKYTILLSILAFGSAQAWDGKLLKVGNNQTCIGCMVRYHDEGTTPQMLEQELIREGFEFGWGGPDPDYFKKDSDDTYYFHEGETNYKFRSRISPIIICEQSNKSAQQIQECHNMLLSSEQEMYEQFEMHLRVAGKNIHIHSVCKDHHSTTTNWIPRARAALKKMAHDHPEYIYEEIDYINGKPVPVQEAFNKATSVWDGKRIQLSLGDSDLAGIELRFYDKQDLVPKKMEQILTEEGFVLTKPEGILQKIVDGISYVVVFNSLWDDAESVAQENHFNASEEKLYQETKEYWSSMPGPKPLKLIFVYLVDKDNSNTVQEWFERCKRAFLRVKEERPDLDFVSMQGKLETSISQPSPWSRFTHFLHEEKIALGLMALTLLTLTVSSR